MRKSKRQFLKVDYSIFDLIGDYIIEGKKVSIDYLDCLIIERILDFQTDNMPCYITNEQLAKVFNSNIRTVARHIANLIKLGIIKSEVTLSSDNGQASRIRQMTIDYVSIGICRHNRNINKYKEER